GARPRVRGLGKPASIPPARGVPTASGLAAPELTDDLDDAPTGLHQRPLDAESLASLTESATALAEEWEAELEEREDPARRARLAYELGRLHEGPLRALERAERHYATALAAHADHLPSLRGARRVALARKKWRDALPLYDAEARITADSARKAALLFAKGRVLEDALGEADAARRAYATAAELDRGNPSILKALEQRDVAAEAWNDLERTLEREANAVARDARHRAALVVERGRLLELREERPDAAIELYETALRLDPQTPGALDALERLCQQRRRWRDLIGVLGRRAGASEDPAERALALYRAGKLQATRLGNRDEAIALLERAVAERPDDPLVLEELAGLYERAERWDRLVEVLARLADATADAGEELAIRSRMGNLLDERLQRPAQAREAFERALALDPTHVPTLQALSRLYTDAEAWDALVAMHLAEAEEASDDRRRAAAHARVADVLERRLEKPAEAIAHHARALSLNPGYAPSFKALARLYADAGEHRALIELHERAIEQADEPEPAITHLFKIGALYEDALGEHGQAAHTYRRVLERDPKHLGALHALQRATERAGRHAELVEALEREADLRTEDARVVDLLQRAAEVLEGPLADTDGAIRRYRRVLEIDAGYAPALGGLGRIYHRTGRWDDLLELYEQELEQDPKGAGAPALLHKMGQLAEERIGDEPRAIECYKRALDVDARHRPSLASLTRRLAARRDFTELVRILELELEGLSDAPARARAAYRLGEVHEQHLEAPDRAAAAYETALAAVPGYAPARDALARLRAEQGAWRRLVDQLEQEAATLDDARAVTRLARAGELWEIALGDPRRAVGCHERALERAPRHLPSLLALERLYRRLSRKEALAKVYGTLARALGDPSARVAALRELARLTEGADELQPIHEAILSLAPDDPASLEALERLALDRGDRALLARVDQRLVAKAGDAKVAAAYQTRLAESLEAADDPAALDAYRAALRSDGDDVAAAKGLARTAAKRGDPEALIEAYRREASVTPEPQKAARLLVRAARARHRQLRDAEGALADYERALELWPDDADAAAGLSELLGDEQPARAADRLARAAGSAASADRVAGLWMEVATLHAERLDNVSGALTALSRVLKEQPGHVPALRRTAALQERQGRWSDAAETLAEVVSLAPDRDVLRDAHLTLARIWDEELDDPARARVSLQAVLSLEETNPAALRRLARLSARTGDPDRAAQTLRKLVDAAPDAEARAAALIELSRVQGDRGDDEAARRAALQALSVQGPGGDAAARHRELVEEKGDWQAHAEALRAWVKATNDPLGRRAARLEVARIQSDELARPQKAIEELEQAVREQPTDVELRRILAVQLRRAGHPEDSAAELRLLLNDHVAEPALWGELAETLRSAGDLDGARRALEVLVLMGAASPAQTQEAAARTRRPGAAHPGALDASVLEALYPTRRASALMELLRHLMPGIGKLYPPDLDAYGLSGRDRMTARSSDPTRQLADRVAAVFAVEDFHLYLHRARARGVAVELSDPPAILVPAAVAELSEAHRVFVLARALADVGAGAHGVDKLTPRELEIVLASICRRVADGFGAGLTSEDILDDIGKRLYKALPRRARKGVDDLATAYVEGERVDFAHFTEAVITSANRVALLVCDDLAAAVESLQRTERDLADLSGPALLRHPMVARLLRFWLSPEADHLRQRCGL
ncbi:MAG TPA: tetratricopeptide repeat protein, partial [Sandaracinaceae bacterium LLY-WYZ-13_1]|nr:tetratricopeptide repeat protein [Sandaracinaceae bacterium LLY-WYZ-13_1]